MSPQIRLLVLTALCGLGICARLVLAADPGELFPETPYSQTVGASPVTHQEESLKKPEPPKHHIHHVERPPTPATLPATAPAPAPEERRPPAAPIWAPYAQNIFSPFLTPEDREIFDRDYAPLIHEALKGTPADRRGTSDQLFEKAGQLEASPILQRYLYLHALGLSIRGAAPVKDREKKARAVLPLLNDRTLAVAQTRAETLDNLAQSVLNNMSDPLARMLVHAYATLAELQAQAGYPHEAAESLQTARHWLAMLRTHNVLLSSQLSATADWVARSSAAANLLPGFQQKLTADPKDPMANTQLALIQLGLYGDLEGALPYAANSDRPEIHKLATLTGDLKLRSMKVDSKTDATLSVPVIEALADVARTALGPDRFLVANMANHRLGAIAGVTPKPAVQRLNMLLKRASDKIMDAADPYESLSDIPDANGGGGTDPGAEKSFNSVADIFAQCPTLPQQFAAQNHVLASAATAWAHRHVIGAHLACTAQFNYAGEIIGQGDQAYIPMNLSQNNVQLGNAFYMVNFQTRLPVRVAGAVAQLRPGQALDVNGTIEDVTLHAWGGDHRIDITIIAKAAP